MTSDVNPCARARPLWFGLIAMACMLCHTGTHAEDCGALTSNYGPFDYRVDRDKLPIVESYHFTSNVEKLVGGATSTTPGPDIEYTLKTFPNHTRALAAVVRWSKKKGERHPNDLRYSVDCHFDRALRFKADDAVVRMLFANWLGDTDRRQEGLTHLDQVKPGDNPFTTYNLGLVYAELGGYEKALELAHKAQALGFTRPGLRQLLEKAGQWRAPSTGLPTEPASSASAPQALK